MDAFVCDTHALVFFASGVDRKLGRRSKRIFEGFEDGRVTLYVPAPVVLETSFLVRSGAVRVPTTLRNWWRLLERPTLVHVDMSHDDVITAAELDWQHEDPYDRLIVSIALRLGAPLVTKDQAIHDWGGIDVVW
jgi:PIN domain nuclease of toxin-antitoxin system